jgi:hypothetical protein
MVKPVWLPVVLVVFSFPSDAATTHKPKHKAHAAQAPKSTKAVKGRSSKSKASRRSSQQAPTPDRYKEIQQALGTKGYLHSEPSGQWDAGSADALKRFQADQNLTPDGKISSLSLIALGLGPRRLTAQSHPAAPAELPKAEAPKTDILK